MRHLLKLCIALCLASAATAASAQAWPVKPIRWICPWAPGGGNDILSRSLADELTRSLGQPVLVENRPGATGTIGTDMVAKAPPDGYTITLGSPGTHSTAQAMYPNLPYDPVRDFTPLTLVGTVANVLVVHPSVPAGSVPALIALLKANPGKYNFSSVGSGSMQHLSGELFKKVAGVDIIHVPYKGTAPALVDLGAGRIQMAFESMPTVLPLVRSGNLKAVAVTTAKRSSLMPEVPTVAEAGIKNFEVTIWYGMFGPAGMPPAVVARLNQAIHAAVRTPALSKRLADLGADVATGTPEELGAYLKQETTKWSSFVREANIKAE
jgi:tripartite-type tricarboxylate transporter receptor subunit TctC